MASATNSILQIHDTWTHRKEEGMRMRSQEYADRQASGSRVSADISCRDQSARGLADSTSWRITMPLFVGVALFAGLCVCQARDPRLDLQQGLFEEEANHNFAAAVKKYEAVVSETDSNRQFAATAIFRLGEIYRRQGRTNEASAQYERILREFPDQSELVKLSRDYARPSEPSATSDALQGRVLDAEIKSLKRLPKEELPRVLSEILKDNLLQSLIEQYEAEKQRHAGMRSKYTAVHPEMQASQNRLDSLKQRIDQQTSTLLTSLEVRRDASLAASAPTSQSGESTESVEVARIRAIIKNSPDLIDAPQGGGETLLHIAAQSGDLDVVKLLLESGADINGSKPFSATALHYAAGNGHETVVRFLLSRGADPNGESAIGITPLGLAVAKGYRTVASTLLQAGATVTNKASNSGGYIGNIAIEIHKGETALHIASRSGYPAIVSLLLTNGAPVDAVDSEQQTPLCLAVQHRDLDAATKLLTGGASPNIGKEPPLYLAAGGYGDENMVQTLLKAGADPNLQSSGVFGENTTPLGAAIKRSRIAIVKVLLQAHADPNKTGINGWPLIYNAISKPEILKLLLDAGANPNPESIPYDIRHTHLPRHQPSTQNISPLMFAVAKTNVESVLLLLEHRANVNATNEAGASALILAVEFCPSNLVQTLVASGANVNQQDADGYTPLEWAASAANLDNVKVLIAVGAEPNIRDHFGLTPLNVAQLRVKGESMPNPSVSRQRASQIEAFLREHGASEDLPNLDRIEVRRPSEKYSNVVFRRGTNDWNHFTLLELLACQYGLISTEPSGKWREVLQVPYEIWGTRNLSFPDLGRLLIRRPRENGTDWTDVPVNFLSLLSKTDCGLDVPVEWGDVVEVPETDHPVSERWRGFALTNVETIIKCLSRQITVRQKGEDKTLTLVPAYSAERSVSIDSETGLQENNFKLRRASFMIRSVLDEKHLILTSSDLAHIHVTRKNPQSGKWHGFILDCSDPEHAAEFWLRDGDVVEIPENQ
jgi:ankyrin repeat protein